MAKTTQSEAQKAGKESEKSLDATPRRNAPTITQVRQDNIPRAGADPQFVYFTGTNFTPGYKLEILAFNGVSVGAIEDHGREGATEMWMLVRVSHFIPGGNDKRVKLTTPDGYVTVYFETA